MRTGCERSPAVEPERLRQIEKLRFDVPTEPAAVFGAGVAIRAIISPVPPVTFAVV